MSSTNYSYHITPELILIPYITWYVYIPTLILDREARDGLSVRACKHRDMYFFNEEYGKHRGKARTTLGCRLEYVARVVTYY